MVRAFKKIQTIKTHEYHTDDLPILVHTQSYIYRSCNKRHHPLDSGIVFYIQHHTDVQDILSKENVILYCIYFAQILCDTRGREVKVTVLAVSMKGNNHYFMTRLNVLMFLYKGNNQ